MIPLQVFGYRRRVGEIGIEIEVEGEALFKGKMDYWKAIPDGSLRGHDSIEYVLSSPVKRKEVSKVLKYIKKILLMSARRDENSIRTSVHIHINVQEMEFIHIINYFCLYSIFEDLLVKWCGKEREGNLFCLRLKDAGFLLEMMAEVANTGNLKLLSSDEIRYASINMAAIAKYGSIEFRAMKGTSDIKIIHTWICMLLQLKDKAILFKHPSEIVYALSHSGEGAFLNTIMEDYAKLIITDNSEALIRQGARRIQEIAYIKTVEKKENPNAPPPLVRPGYLEAANFRQDAYIDLNNANERDALIRR